MSVSIHSFKELKLKEFPIDRITDNSVTDFDLFLSVSDHVILYGSPGYHWYREELQSLMGHGLSCFYIKPEDEPKAETYRRLTMLPVIEKNLPPHERIISIEKIGAEFLKFLYEGEITQAAIVKASEIGNALTECILEDKTCIQSLSGLGDHDYYTYLHSIRVAAYTTAIAVQLSINDEDLLKQMALGGVLHDIGKKEVPVSIINKVGALTDKEWQLMRSHPEKGHQLLQESSLSHVAQEIILHHHEKKDGSGYPHGLTDVELLPEVQIATLADVFDALTSSRSYQQKRTRYEALDFIRHKMLGEKIAPEYFQALIGCLVA